MPYRVQRAPRGETLRLRGVEHHLTCWGPRAAPDRPPLVFLHGFLDTGATFQFVVDALAREHAIVAPDWRGFGRSGWNGGPYWFPDYFADLDALLDALAPESPVTLVGHSMGGNIACLYGGVRPQRVARIVNLEGFGLPRSSPEAAPERIRRWLDQLLEPPRFSEYDSLEQFTGVLMRRNPRLEAARAAFIAASWAQPLPDGRFTVRADPAHKLVNPVLYRRDEAEACWRRCVAPVLLALGGLSELRSALGADCTDEYFRGIYPQLQIATLPHAGHMMHHEDPAAVARLIDGFLVAD
jgi:pimeloyl-ACP methyl ester carboxylesterase